MHLQIFPARLNGTRQNGTRHPVGAVRRRVSTVCGLRRGLRGANACEASLSRLLACLRRAALLLRPREIYTTPRMRPSLPTETTRPRCDARAALPFAWRSRESWRARVRRVQMNTQLLCTRTFYTTPPPSRGFSRIAGSRKSCTRRDPSPRPRDAALPARHRPPRQPRPARRV